MSFNNDTAHLKQDDLKALYGLTYVQEFNVKQSIKRIARLLPYFELKLSDNVVDYACGNGMLLPLIAEKVNSYTGVDFSPDFIDAAQEKQKKLNITNAVFICEEIIKFCNNNKDKFDKAFAMDFSEHVYDETWLELLIAIKSSLKEKGEFYLHTPNGDFFLEKMKKHNFIVKQFPEHIAVRNLEENINILKKAGYLINTVKLLPHYNILKIVHFFIFLPLIGRFFLARIFIKCVK